MVTHFIFLSSSYSLGTRIALDYIVTDISVQEELKQHLDKIIKEYIGKILTKLIKLWIIIFLCPICIELF